MEDKDIKSAISVDYALLAAVNSLTAALSKVPGFDVNYAADAINRFIETPISPDVPDLELYRDVLEGVRFQMLHPLINDNQEE